MAISFQNNPFNNSFSNSLDNLKPRVSKGYNSGNKTENQNEKTDTQNTNIVINSESKQKIYNISPIDKAQNSLANVMLRNLADAIENGYDEIANSMLESIMTNARLPKSSANAPGGSKGAIYIGPIFNATSFEVSQNTTYTLSYNNQNKETSQTLQYSSSFVATFNVEFSDKNGNKMKTQSQLALGKNFENQMTNGKELLSSTLKSFLERQTLNIDIDDDLSQFGEGLNKMFFLLEDNSSQKSKETTQATLLANLKNMLNSNLEMFAGIPKENQNSPALADWIKNKNTLSISASYEQFTMQWVAKKLDNTNLSAFNAMSASFKFEA